MKHYGWGIVDREGERYFDTFLTREDAEKRAVTFNGFYAPYRVVELIYEDEQS